MECDLPVTEDIPKLEHALRRALEEIVHQLSDIVPKIVAIGRVNMNLTFSVKSDSKKARADKLDRHKKRGVQTAVASIHRAHKEKRRVDSPWETSHRTSDAAEVVLHVLAGSVGRAFSLEEIVNKTGYKPKGITEKIGELRSYLRGLPWSIEGDRRSGWNLKKGEVVPNEEVGGDAPPMFLGDEDQTNEE